MEMVRTLNSFITPANITWRVKNGIVDYKVKGFCTTTTDDEINERVINFYNTKLEKVMTIMRKDIEFVTADFD